MKDSPSSIGTEMCCLQELTEPEKQCLSFCARRHLSFFKMASDRLDKEKNDLNKLQQEMAAAQGAGRR